MNKQFTFKLFFTTLIWIICLSTNYALACDDNWTTVADGNWSTGTIWSVNGGPPQAGPPPANACIFVNHTVTCSNSYTLGSSGELTIAATGIFIVQGDLINNNLIVNNGQLTVNNSFTNGSNAQLINNSGSVINIYNDMVNQGCNSVITNYGEINISNSLINKGTVNGNGGIYTIGNDAKNDGCCAIFTGSICVQDNDGDINEGCGMVDSTVMQSFDCSNYLPIKLLSFKGVAENCRVLLTWATASEINNNYFTVERSNDGENFIPVLRLSGAGNSNQVKIYSAYDNEPITGTFYYRLKQTDFDDKHSYSEIIAIDYKEVYGQLNTYYISSSNTVKLAYNQSKTQQAIIEIYSMQGQKIFAEKIRTDKYDLQLPFQPATGTYIVKLVINTNTLTKKLVIH